MGTDLSTGAGTSAGKDGIPTYYSMLLFHHIFYIASNCTNSLPAQASLTNVQCFVCIRLCCVHSYFFADYSHYCSNQIEIEIVFFLFKDLTSNYCTIVGFVQNNKLYISAVLSQEGPVSGSL